MVGETSYKVRHHKMFPETTHRNCSEIKATFGTELVTKIERWPHYGGHTKWKTSLSECSRWPD